MQLGKSIGAGVGAADMGRQASSVPAAVHDAPPG